MTPTCETCGSENNCVCTVSYLEYLRVVKIVSEMLPWLDDRCPIATADAAYKIVNKFFPVPPVKAKEPFVIEYVRGNLLDTDSGVIAHCANCFNTMGAGVAAAIKAKYPSAYEADCKTRQGDKSKLGGFSKSTGKPTIYNLYGQYTYGKWGNVCQVDYPALENAMIAMKKDLLDLRYNGAISLPRLGAGLAGGDWSIIEQMIIRQFCPHWQVKIYSL